MTPKNSDRRSLVTLYGDVRAVACGVLSTLSRQQATHAGQKIKAKTCQVPEDAPGRLSHTDLVKMDRVKTYVLGNEGNTAD
mmetsp:Transcript_46176/g.75559  ORF Transcript_46176/g.75559 Transcript_46176/m.75559 type:complete len:81 (+) Transcript_46176:245-487(+)